LRKGHCREERLGRRIRSNCVQEWEELGGDMEEFGGWRRDGRVGGWYSMMESVEDGGDMKSLEDSMEESVEEGVGGRKERRRFRGIEGFLKDRSVWESSSQNCSELHLLKTVYCRKVGATSSGSLEPECQELSQTAPTHHPIKKHKSHSIEMKV
jgi:hypothetical protein